MVGTGRGFLAGSLQEVRLSSLAPRTTREQQHTSIYTRPWGLLPPRGRLCAAGSVLLRCAALLRASPSPIHTRPVAMKHEHTRTLQQATAAVLWLYSKQQVLITYQSITYCGAGTAVEKGKV